MGIHNIRQMLVNSGYYNTSISINNEKVPIGYPMFNRKKSGKISPK